MLKQRVLTAVLLGVGILLAVFLLPDWAWGAVISIVVLLALHEWCALVDIGKIGQVDRSHHPVRSSISDAETEHLVSVGISQDLVLVKIKCPCPGVKMSCSVRVGKNEHAVTLDSQIGRAPGIFKGTLAVNVLHRLYLFTATDLPLVDGGGKHVREKGPPLLESNGIHVGDIVSDD